MGINGGFRMATGIGMDGAFARIGNQRLTAGKESRTNEDICHSASEILSVGGACNAERRPSAKKKTFCPSQFGICHLAIWIAVLFVLRVFFLRALLRQAT
jgi:hypothetical protein